MGGLNPSNISYRLSRVVCGQLILSQYVVNGIPESPEPNTLISAVTLLRNIRWMS